MSTVHVENSHLEQDGAQVIVEPYGSGDLSIKDSEILVQASTGSQPYILSIWPQTLNIEIDNVSIWSNHTVRNFMRVQGSVTGTINNLHGNGNKMIQALSNAQGSEVTNAVSAFH
jgi:hypothetical protein